METCNNKIENDNKEMRYNKKYLEIAEKISELSHANRKKVGCIIVKDEKIIGKGYNLREKTNKVSAHAEMIAIEKANKKLKSWRLDTCTLYVTIEPCPMCAGAIIQSRIKEVVYGAKELKSGAHRSVVKLFDKKFNHDVKITPGVMEKECSNMVSSFFKNLRGKKQ